MGENKTNEPITVLTIIAGILLVIYFIYHSGIRPGAVKEKCKEESQIKTREKFSNDDLLKDNSTLQTWFLNIQYKNCLIQRGVYNSF